MAVNDQVAAAPQYVKPDYSVGDKISAVFGNDTGKRNKESAAQFQNEANMWKWKTENGDLLRKKGLIKAGINPLVAYAQGVGQVANGSSGGSVGYHGKDKDYLSTLKELMDIAFPLIKALSSAK